MCITGESRFHKIGSFCQESGLPDYLQATLTNPDESCTVLLYYCKKVQITSPYHIIFLYFFQSDDPEKEDGDHKVDEIQVRKANDTDSEYVFCAVFL